MAGDDTFTTDDFALPLSEDLLRRATGDRVSAETARKMLVERFTGEPFGDAKASKHAFALHLATEIVRGLPDAAMSRDLLMALDLRPYLAIASDPAKTFDLNMPRERRLQFVDEFLNREQEPILTQATKEASARGADVAQAVQIAQSFSTDAVGVTPMAGGAYGPATADPTQISTDVGGVRVRGNTADFAPGRGTAPVAPEGTDSAGAPVAVPTTNPDGTAETPEQFAERMANGPVASTGGMPTDVAGPSFLRMIQSPTWDVEPFRRMAREDLLLSGGRGSDDQTLSALANLEQPQYEDVTEIVTDASGPHEVTTRRLVQPFGPAGIPVSGAGQYARPADAFRGPAGGSIPGVGNLMPDPTAPRIPQRMEGRGVSVSEARHYPKGLTESEVTKIQENFEKAGLLEPGKYDKGNPYDDTFEAKWDQVLVESFSRNVPTDQVVSEYARRRQAQEDAARAENQQTVDQYRTDIANSRRRAAKFADPGDTRMIANDYAQSFIGRDLSDAELLKLNAYLGSLARERVDQFARQPPTTADFSPLLSDQAQALGTTQPVTDQYATTGSDDVQRYISENFTPEQRVNSYRNLKQAAYDRFHRASPDALAEARRAINPGVAMGER